MSICGTTTTDGKTSTGRNEAKCIYFVAKRTWYNNKMNKICNPGCDNELILGNGLLVANLACEGEKMESQEMRVFPLPRGPPIVDNRDFHLFNSETD